MKRSSRAACRVFILFLALASWPSVTAAQEARPRARDLGIEIGVLEPGARNSITDVEGVRVGHSTVLQGDSIRTGVTAVLPHGGNVFAEKVPGAIVVRNGFGKLVGLSQVNEVGRIETPILLTGTLSVFRAADALVDTLLADSANAEVTSINPVVGETNDGYLSDIRARPIRPEHVREALRTAATGPVEEGSVGAGTGTRALGWKGGIGTSSRRLRARSGGYTVGALVQTNYGGLLTVAGVPVGRFLEHGTFEKRGRDDREGGSVMIVIATDAPLEHRELERVAERAFAGIARTGSWMSHGSGDYAIAFSTHRGAVELADGELLSGLFVAVAEAVEEAVLNSLFKATTVVGYRGRRAEALPVPEVMKILRRHIP
ncbi:MAG: P1 family peptidase [Gemmatimonadetes bacterium]|nr:P1 family peptidase [Gemmatimonadota bacterium]